MSGHSLQSYHHLRDTLHDDCCPLASLSSDLRQTIFSNPRSAKETFVEFIRTLKHENILYVPPKFYKSLHEQNS